MDIGHIKPRKIIEEMRESYLDYAMSVIVSRALPDVRDGLKPVHRRILYAMHTLGLKHTAKYRKSATVVGEVLGKYHPHGDVAVYDAMVRMAQDFTMRYPLIDGQGNFGSMDGDSPAAMRYTEVRLASISEELILDIEKETVNFADNYDGSQKEPLVLPSKLPNILLNGTMGIAVGMATNIPPHNLSELVDCIIYLIDRPKSTIEDLMKFIKGPDFPTGGLIFNKKEIIQAYATGRGSIVMRGKANILEDKKGTFNITITEIPYQVNKAQLIQKMADLVKIKKIEGIKDIRDESDKEGVRIIIELKKDAYPKKVLNKLYVSTQLQDKFYINMLALVDGLQPRVLTLKMVLEQYIKHRQEIVKRRTQFELNQARKRAHVLEGLQIALRNLDAVIKTIKQSKTKDKAYKNLRKKFKLSDVQTKAILEIKLQQLAALERKKIEEELKEKKKLIIELETLLKSPKLILQTIKNELRILKEKYGDERKTKVIASAVSEFGLEDLIPKEKIVIILTKGGYIKSLPESIYKSQARGGKGMIGMTVKEEDVVEHLLATHTLSDLLFFTNTGKVFKLKAHEIPKSTRTAKGQSLVNFLQLAPQESITALVDLADFKKDKFLAMVTKKGIIKKIKSEALTDIRKSGLIAIKLKKDDELRWVRLTSGKDEIILITAQGQAIRFKEKDIRIMGRTASGVKGIKLRKNDEVIGMDIIVQEKKSQDKLLVITEKGYGKRSNLSNYKLQRRGGFGIKTAKITEKNGPIVTAKIIDKEFKEIIIISEKGQVIRTALENVSIQGRATQGIRMMRLKIGDKVASLAYI